MGNRMISDRDMKAAAQQVMLSMADALPEPPEYEFSEGFLAKMAALIAASKLPPRKNRNILKHAVAAVLALLTITGIFLAANPEARAKVKGWFRSVTDGLYNYWVEEDAPQTDAVDYCPGWVPEGYELLTVDTVPSSTTYLYQLNTDPSTDWIIFTYTQIDPDTPTNMIPLGEHRIEQVTVWGKYTGELIISTDGQDTNTLIWFDTNTNLVFTISSYLGEEQILKIAEKIITIPKEECPDLSTSNDIE